MWGSTHIAEQLLFSMLPSIWTLHFDLILEVVDFLGHQLAIFGVCVRLNTFLGWFKSCFGVYSYRLPTFVF